jgi:hypothetical protein
MAVLLVIRGVREPSVPVSAPNLPRSVVFAIFPRFQYVRWKALFKFLSVPKPLGLLSAAQAEPRCEGFR